MFTVDVKQQHKNNNVWESAIYSLCVSCVSVCECASFPLSFEGGVWSLIVLGPDHCLCFYFTETPFQSRHMKDAF